MVRILFGMDHLIAGGVERQTIELITRLDKMIFSPYVLCLYGNKVGLNYHFLPALQELNIPVRLLDIGHSRLDKVSAIAQIVRLVWAVRPNIVHTVSYQCGFLARFSRLCFPPDTKLICSVRGNYSPRHMRLLKYTRWACSRIVTNGLHLRQHLIEQGGIPPAQLHYIPNGIDLERFSTNTQPHFRDDLVPLGLRCLVYVGRISPEKQLDLILEAINRLKERGEVSAQRMRLIMIGSAGLPAVQEQINHLIAEYGLQEIVVQRPETQTPELYFHAADASILYSSGEGIPNTVLESLAAGCPVIVSEVANAAQIIEPEATGWVVRNNDVDSLAATIQNVLAISDGELKAMQTRCLARAADFSMPAMVTSYESLYRDLLNLPPA